MTSLFVVCFLPITATSAAKVPDQTDSWLTQLFFTIVHQLVLTSGFSRTPTPDEASLVAIVPNSPVTSFETISPDLAPTVLTGHTSPLPASEQPVKAITAVPRFRAPVSSPVTVPV